MADLYEVKAELSSRRAELAANLTAMGVNASKSETLKTLNAKVLEIPKAVKDTAWSPHHDWWDIETMVDTGVLPWLEDTVENIRYGFVVTDSSPTTSCPSGYEYYFSDGTHFSTLASTVVHTWDISYDKDCSEGYKTRAVIVCNTSRDVAVSQRNITLDGIASIYLYFGDCNITNLTFSGESTAANSNYLIRGVHISNSTTASSTAMNASYTFSFCRNFTSIEIPEGVTTMGTYAFYYCGKELKVSLPSSLTALSSYMFSNSGIVSLTIPEGIVALTVSNAFSNCYNLIDVAIPVSTTAVSNAFGNCYGLINFTVPMGFNLALNLNNNTVLLVPSLENIIHNYADRTGLTALILTLGATNLAKLSDEIIAVATSKNITLA